MLFESVFGVCNLASINLFILFTSDCVNMIHQVYIFLAFFNNLGFVEIKAIEEG
jgi:hypothetical protein